MNHNTQPHQFTLADAQRWCEMTHGHVQLHPDGTITAATAENVQGVLFNLATFTEYMRVSMALEGKSPAPTAHTLEFSNPTQEKVAAILQAAFRHTFCGQQVDASDELLPVLEAIGNLAYSALRIHRKASQAANDTLTDALAQAVNS